MCIMYTVHLLLCLLGILVSMFAFYVEKSKERNSDYRAICDISESASCSAVFASRSVHALTLRCIWLVKFCLYKAHLVNLRI